MKRSIAVIVLVIISLSACSPAVASDGNEADRISEGSIIGSGQDIYRVVDDELGKVCYYFSDPSHGFGQLECLNQ